jgi:hypothetical protein
MEATTTTTTTWDPDVPLLTLQDQIRTAWETSRLEGWKRSATEVLGHDLKIRKNDGRGFEVILSGHVIIRLDREFDYSRLDSRGQFPTAGFDVRIRTGEYDFSRVVCSAKLRREALEEALTIIAINGIGRYR